MKENNVKNVEQLEKDEKKKHRVVRRVIPLVFTLIIFFTFGLVYTSGGELSADGVYRAFIVLTGNIEKNIAIPEGFGNAFGDINSSSIVAAGELGVIIIGPDGTETTRELVAFPKPVVASNGKMAVAYSIGGYDALVLDISGTRARIKTDADIRNVYVGKNGVIAISIGPHDGYHGAVKLYKLHGNTTECTYEWYSGTDYILSAALSHDGKMLAALTIGERGGRLAFYPTNSIYLESEAFISEAILEIAYAKNGILFARTRNKLFAVDNVGILTELYDTSGYTIEAFSAGDGDFATLYIANRTGQRLVTVDTRGKSYELDMNYGDAISLRTSGEQTSLLTDLGLFVFRDRTLDKYVSYEDSDEFTDAFPRGETKAIAVGARTGFIYG